MNLSLILATAFYICAMGEWGKGERAGRLAFVTKPYTPLMQPSLLSAQIDATHSHMI